MNNVNNIKCKLDKDKIIIKMDMNGPAVSEIMAANKKSDLMQMMEKNYTSEHDSCCY